MIGKKRLALVAGSLTAVGAVATLVAGTTFGLFAATPVGSTANTFATGTVSIGSPITDANCVITNMVPGDESAGYATSLAGNNQSPKDATCEFKVRYTGSAPAFIGLGTSFSGTQAATTLAGNLLWEVSDGTNRYDGGTVTSGGTINTNTALPLSPLYVATDPGNAVPANGTVYDFKVDYALPLSVTSQTLSAASLTLTVYAVQAGNNGDGSACVVGSSCGTGSTGVNSWS